MCKEKIKEIKEALEIQKENITGHSKAYELGLTNGIILALRLLGEDVEYVKSEGGNKA